MYESGTGKEFIHAEIFLLLYTSRNKYEIPPPQIYILRGTNRKFSTYILRGMKLPPIYILQERNTSSEKMFPHLYTSKDEKEIFSTDILWWTISLYAIHLYKLIWCIPSFLPRLFFTSNWAIGHRHRLSIYFYPDLFLLSVYACSRSFWSLLGDFYDVEHRHLTRK